MRALLPLAALLLAGFAPEADRLALVGQWTDDGDCSRVTELRADGSFVAPNGGVGVWRFEAGRLTIAGSGGSFSWQAEVDGDVMILIGADGSAIRSYRCPAAAQAAVRYS